MSLKEELKEEAGNEKRKLKEMSRQDKLGSLTVLFWAS